MNYGFIKTAASSLKLKVADVSFNTSIIKEAIDSALEKNVKLLVTPELSVTGYTCADLFFARTLLIESERAVAELAERLAIIFAPHKARKLLGGLGTHKSSQSSTPRIAPEPKSKTILPILVSNPA